MEGFSNSLIKGIRMIPAIKEEELFQACRVLFGEGLSLSRDFLDYIQRSGIKRAYRRKVHEFHPDKAAGKSENFIALQQAYEELSDFLVKREKGVGARQKSGKGKNGHKATPPRRQSAPPRAPTQPFSAAAKGHPDEPDAFLYKGPMPSRPLLLGHYLYYSGMINWRTIIRALVWQRNNRPRLGEIGRQLGWLKQSDVARIMTTRASMEPFGEAAVKLGVLSCAQVEELLERQRVRQRLFGEYFVASGMFSHSEMADIVVGLERHNAVYGEKKSCVGEGR